MNKLGGMSSCKERQFDISFISPIIAELNLIGRLENKFTYIATNFNKSV